MGRIRWATSLAAFAAHLAVAGRYDFFRDELYFIACGRRPAFGYVDQPPLVPLVSAATQAFGERLWLLRAVAALAAFGAVWFTCKLAELMEARAAGVLLAGAAAATAPMFMGVTSTFNTSCFEPMLWAALAYFLARAVVLDDRRAWLFAGLVAGLDLEAKYELPLRLLPLLLALLVTGRARSLWRREALLGGALATALALPSFAWQAAHGLPFLELIRNGAAGKNAVVPAGTFVLNQVVVMNPVWFALAVAGAVAPFVDRRLRPWRFLALGFLLTAALVMGLHGKDYYLAPVYGPVFALGAAALDGWLSSRAAKLALLVPALALSAVAAPMAMPILDPPQLAAYIQRLGVAPKSGEKLDQSDIPQTFADMLGWRELAREVTAAVRSLPPADQARAVVLGKNYGDAAALQFYAPGLEVIGRHNQYWLWGPGQAGSAVVLFVREPPDRLKDHCAEVRVLGHVGTPHAMPYESGPIVLCRGLKPSLGALWPELKLII